MKKYIIILILMVGVLLVVRNTDTQAEINYKDATYDINNLAVTLVDGYSESTTTQDSATKIITKYFGNETIGDLNSDGIDDTAFIMTQELGGSGTFYYIAVALGSKNGFIGKNAILLGDRIAPQTTEIKDGEIIVNYADRAIGEPMTTKPSVGVSKYLKIINGSLQIAK